MYDLSCFKMKKLVFRWKSKKLVQQIDVLVHLLVFEKIEIYWETSGSLFDKIQQVLE